MNDTMNEITAFSPFGGRLVLEEVKGAQERANVPENSIETKAGDDRSMYVYVPASGCPDAKQTQVVMFLRDGADEASAQAAMKEYGLDALAEKEHFVLAFPNPRQSGWSERDAEDMDYLSRCFMALPQGKGKVGGFIGMIFYIGGSPSAGALLLAMSARRPLNVAGVLLSELPADYSIPQDGMNAPQVAYLCGGAARAAEAGCTGGTIDAAAARAKLTHHVFLLFSIDTVALRRQTPDRLLPLTEPQRSQTKQNFLLLFFPRQKSLVPASDLSVQKLRYALSSALRACLSLPHLLSFLATAIIE